MPVHILTILKSAGGVHKVVPWWTNFKCVPGDWQMCTGTEKNSARPPGTHFGGFQIVVFRVPKVVPNLRVHISDFQNFLRVHIYIQEFQHLA